MSHRLPASNSRVSGTARADGLKRVNQTYYDAEAARWPALSGCPITGLYARMALVKINRAFRGPKAPEVSLSFSNDRDYSWGWPNGIELGVGASWLTFLHELAHAFDEREHPDHDIEHAAMVDKLCAFVTKEQWPADDIADQFEAKWGDAVNLDAVEPPTDEG